MARNRTTVFFHADADGCCSAALLVRALNKNARLVPVGEPSDLRKKPIPQGNAVFLDLGTVTEGMVRHTEGNVMVIDHHLVGARLPCVHINPALEGKRAYPVSYMVYKIFGGPKRIALAGCIGDWFLPPGVSWPKKPAGFGKSRGFSIGKAYYKSSYGKIARAIDSTCAILGERGAILSVRSLLRGKISGTMWKCLKTVTDEVNAAVGANLEMDGKLASLVFSSRHRIKSQVAQLLKVKHKRKIIFVGQLEGGKVKFSIREGTAHLNLNTAVRKCLSGLRGEGGGHAMAAGGWVDRRDFDVFLGRLKREVNGK